jgi:hypothetical protein
MNANTKLSKGAFNSLFFQKSASQDPMERQKIASAITDITRLTLRDEGIVRKVLPPESITIADCHPQLDSDMPVKFVDKEVVQPLSATIPLGTLPRNYYMRGKRYRVDFARIATRSYNGDVRQLETYGRDMKEVFKENAIMDMSYIEDSPFMGTINDIVTPTSLPSSGAWSTAKANMVSPLTGKVQYYDYTHASRNPLGAATGFTRESFLESFKILQTGFTPNGFGNDDQVPIRLKTHTCLMNVNTAIEFAKLDHDAFGGPGAEDMLKSGVTETTWNGHKFIYTMKDDIVLDGEMYMFADPGYLGKFYELDAPTMFYEQRAFMIEFFIYAMIGMSIGNPFGAAKVKFF